MKKLVTAFAACALAGLVDAQVESINVVGYYSAPVEAEKYSLIALNLNPMTPDATISIQDLIPGTTPGLKAAAAVGSADQIRAWDQATQTYKFYYLYKGYGPNTSKSNKWVENVAGQPVATATFKTGDALFFYAASGSTLTSLTIPGQVPNTTAGVLRQGYNMIGAGFPADWNPNDAGTEYWSDATKYTAAAAVGSADQIRTWDQATQTYKFYYLYKGYGPNTTKSNKWVENVAGQPVMTETLDTSAAFFYYKVAAGEVVFNPPLPYTL
jgi:hypothetical protein